MMPDHTVYLRTTRRNLYRLLEQLPQAARSNSDAGRGMWLRVGMAALSIIREAFVVKARGGVDETGLSWKPLSPKTIAYSRRHPGLPQASVRAARAPSYALTPQGRRLWWRDYSIFLARYKGDKGHAAAAAWRIAKDAGETTLMDRYGNTPVEILRDTGLLLNSLSPGIRSQAGREAQVLRPLDGEVIVGTNRKWARVHHEGSRDGRIPQRRLWPMPQNWPASWWQQIQTQAREGLIEVLLWALRSNRR